MSYQRDYKREYELQKKRKENGVGHDGGSAVRHRARRKMLKLGLVKPGRDVDHKKPLVRGGGNAPSNLRSRSKHANRSFPRTKDAGMKE